MNTIATSLAAAALAAAGLFTGAGAQDQQVMEMPTPPAEMVELILDHKCRMD